MAKRRAYELSRELGIEVKELMAYAKEAGVLIKNHMSSVNDEDIKTIVRHIDKNKIESVIERRVAKGVIRRRAVRRELHPKPEEGEAIESAAEAKEPQAPGVAQGAGEIREVEAPDVTGTISAVRAGKVEGEAPLLEAGEAGAPAEKAVPEETEPGDVSTREGKPALQLVEGEAAAKPAVKARKKARATAKRRIRRPRQIATIIKRIELEDLEPAEPQSPAVSGKAVAGREVTQARRTQARRTQQQLGPVEFIQPIIDTPGRKRGGRADRFVEDEGKEGRKRRSSKGFRKRQIIDESYVDRRGRGPGSKKRLREIYEPLHTQITTPKAIKRVIRLASDSIIVGELAKRMGIKANEIILKLIQMGLQINVNQAIDLDTAMLVASEFGYEVESVAFEEEQFLIVDEGKDESRLKMRPPVVTVMGHVDHGKTSILDYVRKTNVAENEAGGITQHIGAYIVRREGGNVTFLDTPGHEAFTSMRARGAQVTDVVILVVAADDGVMPQTEEAISHAKAAEVPIIVAINKIDKANADASRVRQELMRHGLVPEELGGDTIMVNLSAKTGEGIDDLLEMLSLQAEVLELKADSDREQAGAVVVEGRLDRGRGSVGTILVRQGTLRVGDHFVCGTQAGRVKALIDDLGKRVESAGPSVPVEVLGFDKVPEAGEMLNTLKDEKQAKVIAQNRRLKRREAELAKSSRVSFEELVERVKAGDIKTLSLIIKSDVQGTREALRDSLTKLSTDEVQIDIIHTGVGGINESDVLFASASQAMIIGFNVRAEAKAQALADSEKIDIRLYGVIYNVLEDIEAVVAGLRPPKIREDIFGHAEVRDTFNIPKVGTIAGSYVLDGKILRHAKIRLLRENVVIYTGMVASLKRFKDDVSEVATGFECGIGIENYNDVKVGDQIEFYQELEVKPEPL